MAVHGNKTPAPEQALNVVRELAHVLYWAGRTYLRKGAESLHGKTFDESLVPTTEPGAAPASVEELDALKRRLDAAEDARKDVEGELEALRERLAAIKAENEAVPETRDWNEGATRRLIIDLALRRAGWPLDQEHDREYEVTGMPNTSGVGYADYVLWGDDGKPLAVVEAKKTTVDAAKGRQQAKLYADCLEAMHGQRPVIYYTNGYETCLWDDRAYAPRAVAGFHKKDELASLLHRRAHREPLDVTRVRDAIVERYYQKRAIGSIGEQFGQARRKALLVMATGSGKTRVAIALVDLLQRAGWVKRALFLADRVSLVNQAVGAFKAHLPESSPVNLVTEKDKAGRVYICTYPTMMGLIDETTGTEARFGVGHFDLVFIDEAHRSVYQKYGAIFRYFDSLLVGLTATPRDQVDRNTYELFDLEPGVPTDAYELATAVADGFLVPPKVQQVDLRFPREGIDYDSLSEEEQAQWESLDWGDDEDGGGLPERVDASAINNWLLDADTVDKVLQHLMEVIGYRVWTLRCGALQVRCDGGGRRSQQVGDHGVGVKLALGGGADEGGEDLLCVRAPPGAIAAADFAGDDGGTDGLLGAPVGGVDGGVAQEVEQRGPFGDEVIGEALDVGERPRVGDAFGEASGQRVEGVVHAGGRAGCGAGLVAQAESLLQGGLDLDDDPAVRMIGSQRLCPA